LRKQGKDAYEEEEEEDLIYFDQTSKHIGSINKNMLFSQNDDNALNSRATNNKGLND
jgi:hypothetical protein